MIDGLRDWIRCLRGDHLWVQMVDPAGDCYVFCLHCGERP